jgi:hypothetical protein
MNVLCRRWEKIIIVEDGKVVFRKERHIACNVAYMDSWENGKKERTIQRQRKKFDGFFIEMRK